jgi:sulfur-carrier protein adenylyltransferase/sulfurtransferase
MASVPSINVVQLKEMIDSGADFQLIDVREPAEYDAANLNGVLIPLNFVLDRADEITKDKPVVIHCRSGKRSEMAIKALLQNLGYENLHNLEGGILAWAQQIDPSLQVN